MSILIKGMEMPRTGRYFVAVDNADGKDKTVISVMSEFERGDKTRPLLAVCEAVPVPPHGRLIDADEFLNRALGTRCFRGDYALMLQELVGESITIIPVEGISKTENTTEEGET